MIERASEFGASLSQPLTPGDAAHLSAGDMLRQAREMHGLHVEVVAAALKVPPQKIEALEDDNIDALPDPVFARALAASMARALRIDPAPVLAKLPGAQKAALAEADRSLGGNIRSRTQPRSAGVASWRPSRLLAAVVIALLLGAAALIWLPQTTFDRLGAWLAEVTGGRAETQATVAAESVQPPPPAGIAVEPVTALPAVEPSAPAAAQPVAPEPVAPASTDPLVLTAARGESWVTVTDSAGKVLLRRTVAAGETVHLAGTLPFAVVVGRAVNMDARVHGKAFDLAPLTKAGGVARFDVKPS